MTLKERLTEDMKSAMKGAEKQRLSTIRMAQAAIKQREVDERIALDDAQVLAVLEKMIKQRKESIVQFEQEVVPISLRRNARRSSCCRRTCPRSSRPPSSTR